MFKMRTAIAVLVWVAVLISGCGQTLQKADVPAPTRSYGGTFVYALNSDISVLAPILVQDSQSSIVTYQIHEGLVRYEGNYKIVGALASGWEVSADGRVWTFTLREKVKWHDGQPFTSADVKFTYDKLLDPATRSPRRKNYLFIKEVQAPNPTTVKFILQEPFGPFLDRMTLGIMAKHQVEKVGLDRYNQYPVGTGPFKFKEWVPGDRVVLEANTSYWQGRPYLDKVIFKPIPETSARMQALKKGEVNYVSAVPMEEFRSLEANPGRYELFRIPSLSFAYLAINNQNPLFRDIRVREALACAVDKNAIIKEVLAGMAVPSVGPVSPVNEQYYNPEVKRFSYNPEHAKKLLEDAGYNPGKDQIRQNSLGKRLEFSAMVRSGDPVWKTIATMIQKWFLDIGVKMNIEYVDWSVMNMRLDERAYEAAMLSFAPGPDPDQFNLWHSSAIDGGFNDWCYFNPEVDKLLEMGRRESDQLKRREIYKKMQDVLGRDVAAVWLYHPLNLSVLDSKFKGMTSEPMGQDRYLHKVYQVDLKPKTTGK